MQDYCSISYHFYEPNVELTGPDYPAHCIDHTPAKPDLQRKLNQTDAGSGSVFRVEASVT